MKSLMISKSKVEISSLRMPNNVLFNPKFYDLLSGWILDSSKGKINLSSYYTYNDFCSTFSIDSVTIKENTKSIQKSTPDGCVVINFYRTLKGINVYVSIHTEELEIVEDKH